MNTNRKKNERISINNVQGIYIMAKKKVAIKSETKKDAMKKKIKQKQKQKQRQETNINIRIGDSNKKQSQEYEKSVPSRQLPPVVYQTLPQLVYYNQREGSPSIASDSRAGPAMLSAPKPATTILEDIGSVGTEGLVEILDKPTKRETLSELITPVKKVKKVPAKPKMIQDEDEPEKIQFAGKMAPSDFPIKTPSVPLNMFSPMQTPKPESITDAIVADIPLPDVRMPNFSDRQPLVVPTTPPISVESSREPTPILRAPSPPVPFVPMPQEEPAPSIAQTVRDVRSIPGKKGGLYSKKMTDEEKTAGYLNIPLEQVTEQDIQTMKSALKADKAKKMAESRTKARLARITRPIPQPAIFPEESFGSSGTSRESSTREIYAEPPPRASSTQTLREGFRSAFPDEPFGVSSEQVIREPSVSRRQTSPRPRASSTFL